MTVEQLIAALQDIVRKSPSFGQSLVHLETCCDCNPLEKVVQGAVDVFLQGYP